MSRFLGQQAEHCAEQFLIQQGFTFVARNFLSRFGEIDLIFKNQYFLLFVEVKSRQSARFGHAIEMVTISKQKKIKQTADCFLQKQIHFQKLTPRFDVIVFQAPDPNPIWIPHAF